MSKRWLALLLVFFLLYFALENLSIYKTEYRTTKVERPIEITREVTVREERSEEVCENVSFRFTTAGGNVEYVASQIRPDLTIINLDDRWGYFKANYTYFEETLYPYAEFGGDNLREKLDSGELDYSMARFVSDNYVYYIGPGEAYKVLDTTPRPDSKLYWAIANIIEPEYESCREQLYYRNVTQNKTFTEYVEEERQVPVKSSVTLAQYFGIGSLWEWLLILLLLCIIIYLIFRIKDKYESGRS